MRFQFATDPNARIRPIPELPDFPVSRIEGRNGIGKSLAIRLLQLVTGDQPYLTMPAAWNSLKHGLAPFELVVTSLRGASEIRCRVDPGRWPENVEAVGDWVADYLIDGRAATLNDVRALLTVYRIAGDESLLETISARITEDAALTSRVGGLIRSRADAVDVLLGGAAFEIERANPRHYLELVRLLATEDRELSALRGKVERAKAQHDQLARARQLLADLEATEAEGPELDAAIEVHDRRIAELRKRVEDLDTKRSRFQASLYHVEELQTQAKKAATSAKAAATRLRNLRVTVQQMCAELAVPSDAVAVLEHSAAARSDLIEAVRERGEIDATPKVLHVVRALGIELKSALDRGIGDREVAELSDARTVSAAELRDGVTLVRRKLIGQPPPEEAKRLDETIIALRKRRDALDDLRGKILASGRAEKALEKHEKRLAELQGELDARDAERLIVLTRELEKARSEQIEAEIGRADLIRRRAMLAGGRSRTDLRRELRKLLERPKMPRQDQLNRAFLVASSEWETHRTELDVRLAAMDSLSEERSTVEEEMRTLLRRLTVGDEYGWLRARWSTTKLAEDDLLTAATSVDRLADAIERARNAVSGAAAAVQSLGPPLEIMATAVLSGQRPSARVAEIDDRIQALRPWYELSFGDHFREPAIQAALFESGEFVRLDLGYPSVTWRTEDGQEQSRPLEAFSSGERVFAYTLARLVSFARPRAANTLIVLDEFGAFVAGDRFSRLERYLHRRVLGQIADQVAVILPLRVDYESVPDPSPSDTGRAIAIRERGYFAEPVSAG
ncbi:MAG: hypothetical protein AABM41_01145 [Chloroflexota bacterium]